MQFSPDIEKRCFWLESKAGPIFTWLYLPASQKASDIGIVLCPPVGHEYVHCHRTYRHLAEHLALSGISVIRFDYFGTGDSCGSMFEPKLIETWLQNVAEQMSYLRSFEHISKVGTFGIRLGASIAFKVEERVQSDFCLLWRPIVDGKRYVRELSAVSRVSQGSSAESEGFYEAGGFPVSDDFDKSLQQLDLLSARTGNTKHIVLLRDEDVSAKERKFESLLSEKSEIKIEELSGYVEMMHEPQFAIVPASLLEAVTRSLSIWVKQATSTKRKVEAPVEDNVPAESQEYCSQTFKESVLPNDKGYFAILTEPMNDPGDEIIVLVNSGSVHHVGPNRLYVEIARLLAEAGLLVVRLDLKNLGDSAALVTEHDNLTYPSTAKDEVVEFSRLIKEKYTDKKLSLAGICSGAYHSFHAATELSGDELNRIVIINPLVFYWKAGMSLAVPSSTEVNRKAKHYEGSLKSLQSWKRLFSGKVEYKTILRFAFNFIRGKIKASVLLVLNMLGLIPKNRLARDLTGIVEKNVEVDFVFSASDPGFGILKDEAGYTAHQFIRRKRISIHQIPEADHTFSKAGFRRSLLASLKDVLSLK